MVDLVMRASDDHACAPTTTTRCFHPSRPWHWCFISVLFNNITLTVYVAGGAERLVVDAAIGLQDLGHSVDIYTSHHDPGHCFEETRDGSSWSFSRYCSVFDEIYAR